MRIIRLKPGKALLPYINCYWSASCSGDMPVMLPGTGAELIFSFFEQSGKWQADTSHLCLPRAHCHYFSPYHQPVHFFSVRFRHGALRHFSPVCLHDINDNVMTAEALWGSEANVLMQLLSDAKSASERITLIESFLLKQFERYYQPQHSWLDYAFQQLYYHYANVDLHELPLNIGISSRYFQKIFKQSYGITPKHFQRLVRFESVTKHLLLKKESHYLTTALNYGYYDQAHFIKDFKGLTGETPGLFFQEENFRSHFYNASPLT